MGASAALGFGGRRHRLSYPASPTTRCAVSRSITKPTERVDDPAHRDPRRQADLRASDDDRESWLLRLKHVRAADEYWALGLEQELRRVAGPNPVPDRASRRARSETRTPRCHRGFRVARPGLEPGTPRFSGSRGGAISAGKGLQIRGFRSDAVWRDGVGSGRFRGSMGLRPAVEVPMTLRPPVTGWTRAPVLRRSRRPPGTRLPRLTSMTSGLAHDLRRKRTSSWRCPTLGSQTGYWHR
jgi:hypothetical protein